MLLFHGKYNSTPNRAIIFAMKFSVHVAAEASDIEIASTQCVKRSMQAKI